VFDGEERATAAILDARSRPRCGRNPERRPKAAGDAGNAKSHRSNHGRGLAPSCIDHGWRFSGEAGLRGGHISPEAAVGGPIGLIRNGDSITIDARARTIQVDLSARKMKMRRAEWRPRKAYATTGVLAKYAYLVGSASSGAVMNYPSRTSMQRIGVMELSGGTQR